MTVARDIAAWIGASETAAGPVELATQAEVDAGTVTDKVVTPSTLAGAALVGRLIDVQIFTSSGTWTKPTGTQYIRTRMIGGGGGGGGALGINPGTRAGGGGGSGRYRESYVMDPTALNSSHSITVGAAGTGGAAGDNDGTNGGQSAFGVALEDAYHYAGGGLGGARGTSANGGTPQGSGSGVGVTQLFSWGVNGGRGIESPTTSNNTVLGGFGGSGKFGGGGVPGAGTTGNGTDAVGYGGGGAGGHAVDNTSPFSGGDGSPGILIVESYA